MKLESFLIGIGLFSVIAVIFMAATTELATNYVENNGASIQIDNNQTNAFNKAAKINNISQTMQSKLVNNPTGSGITSFLSGAYSAVITTFDSLSLSAELATETVGLFGLPPALAAFIISAVVIMIVMMLVYLIFAGNT